LKQLNLSLPLPNSANTHWRHGRGVTYLSKQGRDYRYLVANAVKDANQPIMTGRLFVDVLIYPRDKRKTDIDNRLKPLLDALQHAGAFEDDSQIDRLYVERREIIPGGKCEVVITEILC
jgi:crossover junction endodeoxyribonuclease RusA